jgi:hypothetical protein
VPFPLIFHSQNIFALRDIFVSLIVDQHQPTAGVLVSDFGAVDERLVSLRGAPMA